MTGGKRQLWFQLWGGEHTFLVDVVFAQRLFPVLVVQRELDEIMHFFVESLDTVSDHIHTSVRIDILPIRYYPPSAPAFHSASESRPSSASKPAHHHRPRHHHLAPSASPSFASPEIAVSLPPRSRTSLRLGRGRVDDGSPLERYGGMMTWRLCVGGE